MKTNNINNAEALPTFEETINNIRNGLKTPEMARAFMNKHSPSIQPIIESCINQLICLQEERDFSGNSEISDVINVLKLFQSHLLSASYNVVISETISNILNLLFNWNTNICKSNDIALQIKICIRIKDSAFTLIESINIIKTLITKAELLMEVESPSLKISDKYLSLMIEE